MDKYVKIIKKRNIGKKKSKGIQKTSRMEELSKNIWKEIQVKKPEYEFLENHLNMKGWRKLLNKQFNEPYFNKLKQKLMREHKPIYPPIQDTFAAFNACDFKDVKVVILGQDPYHGFNQAHGLSFSVKKGIRIPPSLKNIYKELSNTIKGFTTPSHGCLQKWADQGVLMLNTCLTVKEKSPGSHIDYGWTNFTDEVIRQLDVKGDHIVFILWGSKAKQKAQLIVNKKSHLILKSTHPSPYSANDGFFGSNHFNQCNNFLKEHGKKPIDWTLSDKK